MYQNSKYPTSIYPGKSSTLVTDRNIRPSSMQELTDNARTTIGEQSFCINAGKIWNNAPKQIKEYNNLKMAKKLIKF